MSQIRKVPRKKIEKPKVRPKKKERKKEKGPHLFGDEKLGKFSKIRTVHPENSESSSVKFGKLSQIRKVETN